MEQTASRNGACITCASRRTRKPTAAAEQQLPHARERLGDEFERLRAEGLAFAEVEFFERGLDP